MSEYKEQFIHFLIHAEALQFGEFTLKSGRVSPYFFNSSLFNTGRMISRLGYFYAAAIQALEPNASLIFGPAYKGIPLCIATASALADHFDRDIGYFFNRKEAKTHGDKGLLVGSHPKSVDRIIMVDDVITDGATKKEALNMVQQLSNATLAGIVIAVDRMESNTEGKDTCMEFQNETGIPVQSIVTIEEICEYLLDRKIDGKVYITSEIYQRIEAYLQKYKVRP